MVQAPLLALQSAILGFGGRPLFDGVDLAVGRGDRICLLGRNGAGKSTLLKVLAGRQELDGGTRFLQPGTRVSYLSQEPDVAGYATVEDYVAAGLPPDGGRHAVGAVLDRLDLDPGRDPSVMSGGEQRRAALAHALVSDPDVLLLDEPTNHLDLPTIAWLEDTLDAYRGALVLISHDRRFLTRLGRRVAWLDRGRIRATDRGFAEFEVWQQEVFEQEEQAAHKLDRKIAEETRWSREGISARRRRNMGRVRNLGELRRVRAEQLRGDRQVQMAVAEAGASGRLVVEVEDLGKSFDGRPVVKGFSTRILRGDRVGVIGPNGAGKTTLLKMLIGELPPDTGTIRHGTNLELAVFDQRRASLDPEATLRRTLLPDGGDWVEVGGRRKHIAGYLQDFLFESRQMDQPVKALSGGERNRLLLARLFARPSNLLVLDEPTNDLDMDTLDLLEEVLADYQGTLIMVSHDRDFLDRLVTSVIAVEGDGRVVEVAGGWSDYARWKQAREEQAGGQVGGRPAAPAKPDGAATPSGNARPARTGGKLSYKDQRELDQLPARIEALTAKLADLRARLEDPDLYARDPNAFDRLSRELATAQEELAAAEDRWLELEAQREDLTG
ncbi:MAG TPA: ATP-binding cassette domain-containing protein [Azospirillaceae bacterium]|nr:ATP-binding cassette domain-containing protein [Azospirillaceae bacterium]